MLDDRHALVTGGGTGIGLAIAQALAGAGAQVTITGRRAEILAEAAGERLHPQAMDVADEASVIEGVAAAVAERGPVQICIANAGVAEGRALHRTDTEFWRRIMATNLDGAFWTIRECVGAMRDSGWGRVIAVSSIAGLRGLRGASAYSASKHGLVGLVRSLAQDYAGGPITFNALCPGYVDTGIVSRNVESISQRTGMSSEDALGLMVRENRSERLIRPDEVANAALLLCRPGSEAITGLCVEIS